MKKAFAFLLLFMITVGFAQGLNGELGFNDNYHQQSQGIICSDEFSYLVKQQSYSSSFFTTCSLIKIDTIENIIWESTIAPTFAEYISVEAIIPSESGGVYLAGKGIPTCDVSSNCFSFIQKYNSAGSLEWSKLWVDEFCSDFKFSGLTMDQNNFLHVNYSNSFLSKIYEIDFNGNLTDSLEIIPDEILQINSSNFFEKIASKDVSLYGFNSLGVVIASVDFTSPIKNYLVVNDTIFLLTNDSIFSFNSSFGLIDGTDLPGYLNYSHLKSANDKIQFISHGLASQDILELDHQLQLVNITSIPTVLNLSVSKDYNDYHLTISENYTLTEFKTVRHLDYSVLSGINQSVNWTDIGITNFAVTVVNANATTWPEIYEYEIYGDVQITNFGTTTLNSCRINHFIAMSIACGYEVYSEEFTNLDLAPGDNMWISLGLIESSVDYFPVNPIVKSICLYTSHPNTKTDLVVPNDEYCTNVTLGYVDLTELNSPTKQLIKIVDLLGRETVFKPNMVLIYMYSDGTIEKVFYQE